jgi:hypothetical protein
MKTLIALVCWTCSLGVPGLAVRTEATSEALQWAVAPSLLPPSAMIALVSGDPTGPGVSTTALSMPNGYLRE